MEWKYSLSTPAIDQDEVDAVSGVLRSRWLSMGGVTQEFEEAFARKMGVRHALAVANCTAALHMANLAAGVGPGDEVICPDITFVASANASRYCGARVVLADVVSAEDLTVDPGEIETLITPRTRAVTVVHYAGFACDMARIERIARERGIAVIEDCAHAPFAACTRADGRRVAVGTVGIVGCFSFFGNKNMTTGEGGIVTTDDDAVAEKLRLLRSHGMTTASFDRFKGHASSYDVVLLGYNYRMDDVHAAIGLAQLAKIDRLQECRRRIYGWYWDALGGNTNLILPFRGRDLRDSSCHIFPIIARQGSERIKQRLFEARVQTSRHYQPVSGFSIYGDAGVRRRAPEIEHLITLPLSPEMEGKDVEYIARVINEA